MEDVYCIHHSSAIHVDDRACDKTKGTEDDNSKVIVKYKGGEITEKEFDLEQRMIQFMSPEYAQFYKWMNLRSIWRNRGSL